MSTRRAVIAPHGTGRRKARGGWKVLGRVLWLALLVEVGAALYTSPAFRVHQVTVEGLRLTRPEEVVQAMELGERSNWLFLSPSRLAHRVQRLPAVAEVVVARRLWANLHVRVFERQPRALLRTSGGSYWIDMRGVPFWKTDERAGLAEIVVQAPLTVRLGQPVSHRAVQAALDILDRHAREYGLPVLQIVVDREGNLCLNMKGGLPRVKLGDSTGLARKMACAAELWQQPELVQQAEYLDVSYVEKPVWKPRRSGKGAAQ